MQVEPALIAGVELAPQLIELLTADYTVVDATAARFYGLAAPTGGPGVAPYGDGRRAGVFGHASVLASTAHSDQTSPIRRGLWVRRNLLCQELPPPPPPPALPNSRANAATGSSSGAVVMPGAT